MPPNWRYRGWTRQRENEEYEPRQLDYFNGMVMVHPQRLKVTDGRTGLKYETLDQLIDWMRDYDKD